MATKKQINYGIFIFSILTLFSDCETTKKQYCPKICICDIYEEMKRADCSGQNLVTTYTDVPNSVEVLYLNRNKISMLDNEELSDYSKIIVLDLSKNDIHTIYLDAFAKMQKLHKIDLSENRLEQLDNRIFELNKELIEIDLSNNKFMTMSDSPFLMSESLQVLLLAESHMSHLYTSSFEKLPKLTMLDISSNLLKHVDFKYFENQQNLELLNLKQNPWSCDASMQKLIDLYKQRKVSVIIDSCLKSNSRKFEKILMGTFPASQPEDVDIDLVWTNEITNRSIAADFKLPFDECNVENEEQNCELLKICQSNYATLFEKFLTTLSTSKGVTGVLVEHPAKCHGMTLGFLLFAGFFLGVVVSVSVMCLLSMCRIQNLFSRKKTQRRRYQEAMRERAIFVHSRVAESPLLAVRRNENSRPESQISTPIALRNRQSPQIEYPNATQAPIQRNRQSPQIEYPNATQALIHKLFRRPARQFRPPPANSSPRSNGVTTIAIRRLSDSSLESTTLRRNDNSVDVFTTDCTDTLEHSLIGRPTSDSNDSLQRLRCETPPPPYDFIKGSNGNYINDDTNT